MVKALVEENYVKGQQNRCKRWCYKYVVQQVLPMSERTFWRLLSNEEEQKEDKNQLMLNFEYD